MTTGGTEARTARPAEDFARANDLFSAVRRLAAEQTTPSAFVGEAFRALAQGLAAPFAALKARVGTRALEDYWHTGSTDPNFWKETVDSAIDTCIARASPFARLYRAKGGTGGVAVLVAPMPDAAGDVTGAMGFVLECENERRAHESLALVRAIAAMMPELAAGIARQSTRDSQSAAAGGTAVQALVNASSAKSRAALAITITNQLRVKVGCEQVAIAAVRGHRPRLLAISGFADVSERSPGVAVMLAAMSEALDLQRTVAWSPTEHTNDYALHRRWSAEAEGAAVATIPLKHGDEITALVALRQAPGRRFTEEDLKKICEIATPFAAALELVHRATRSVPEHANDSARRFVRSLFDRRELVRTCGLIVVSVALLWFTFGTTIDHASMPCRLTSSVSVHLAAPYDGNLREAAAMAGDSVKAGQVLARFDTQDLELERGRLNAAVEKGRIEADQARARGREAEAMLTEARAGVDRAALRTVERKIAGAVVTAPTDGVILSGDLRRNVGSSIGSGQALYEFAPNGALKVELAIPARDIQRVQVGAAGEFIAMARPDLRVPIVIDHVRPSAEVRDGQNVFIAEATLDASEPWLRSGVEGFAKIDAGKAPVWKVYLRRTIDFVRLKLWL